MNTEVIICPQRDAYSKRQLGSTMTVEELITCLEGFDKDAKVYFSFDSGYTYGRMSEDIFEENTAEDEDDED